MNLCALSCEAESRGAATVIKDGVDSLQEDVTEDVEANASVGLNSTEAAGSRVVDRRVVDICAWNGKSLTTDRNIEIWQTGLAVEDVSTLRLIDLRTRNLAVVRRCYIGWEVKQGSASVCDGGSDATGGGIAGTGRIASRCEAPETLRAVDWNISDGTSVLGSVDIALDVRQ